MLAPHVSRGKRRPLSLSLSLCLSLSLSLSVSVSVSVCVCVSSSYYLSVTNWWAIHNQVV